MPGTEIPAGTRAENPCVADANAGEADAAEIVDPLDRGRQQAGRRRRDMDEFRPHADLDFRAGRQHAVIAIKPMIWPSMRASCLLTAAGTMFMPGEPMK